MGKKIKTRIWPTNHEYRHTKIYHVWAGMKQRCTNKRSKQYKYYGGRGIGVCKEWAERPDVFCKWALENGYKKGLELDRIDNDSGYSPENCHFITHKENCAPGKRGVYSNNKTGISGVTVSGSGTFEVYHLVDGKTTYMGVFKTVKEAGDYKKSLILADEHKRKEPRRGERVG